MMKRCKQCGKQFDTDARFCIYCGGELENTQQNLYCVKCGKILTTGSKFCVFCGEPVTDFNNSVNGLTLKQKLTFSKILQAIPFHLLNKKTALIAAAVLILLLGGVAFRLIFGNSIAGPEFEEDMEMPTSISKIDRTKTTPVFDKNFEKVVNYKRKTIAGPIYVRPAKEHTQVFDKPEGKVVTELALNTMCEVGDYEDKKTGTWLYLRLIQIKDKKNDTPVTGWVRESDVIIDTDNSLIYIFTDVGIAKPAGNYRFLYRVLGRGNVCDKYGSLKYLTYEKPKDIYIDLDSIKMDDANNYIRFACLTMPDKKTDYYRYSLKGFGVADARQPELPSLPNGKTIKHKWVKNNYGIYFDALVYKIITPPGDLMQNGFIRVLEGK